MASNTQMSISIKSQWIPFFIGRKGQRAQLYKTKYHLSVYNVQPFIDEQGYRSGIIYIKGNNASIALMDLKHEILRLEQMDTEGHGTTNYENYDTNISQQKQEKQTDIEAKYDTKHDCHPQHLPSNTEDNFPSLPIKNTKLKKPIIEQKIYKSTEIEKLTKLQTTIEEQHILIQKLQEENARLYSIIHANKTQKSNTIQIKGVPNIRMTGEPITISDMYSTFSKSADISSIKLEKSLDDTQTCYVTFTKHTDADMMLKFLNGNMMEGNLMNVSLVV